MRVLTVGSLPPEWGGAARGGVASFHAALLEGLLGHGEVEIAGVLAPAPPPVPLPFPVFARPEGTATAEFYEDLLERLEPDLVVMNHVANTVGVTHAGLADPPPAVGIAHSWHNITFRDGEERERARAVTEEALGGLTALVCPSHHCEVEGRRLGLPYPARTTTIHYPLQPLYLEEGIDVEAGGRSGILFVGSLIERKNPAGLVEAAALLPGFELTLVGEGEEEGRLRELVDRLGIAGRVRFAELPEDDHPRALRSLFLRSSVLCLPSESESFGIVLIEALACGTPVVGFAPTVREIGVPMGRVIGEPLAERSPLAIAATLVQVAEARWDRAALRRAAVEAFALDRAVSRYLKTFRECLRD